MTNIYDWLEEIHQPFYAPTSPLFISRNGSHFTDISTDEITPLDIGEEDNMYFNYPHAQSQIGSTKQPPINAEPTPIDPSLSIMANPPMPPTSDQITITVPAHLADVSPKILIYLTQIIDAPGSLEKSVEDMDFTAEEFEASNPLPKKPNSSSPASSTVFVSIWIHSRRKSKK